MRGFYCKACRKKKITTELHYEQIQGMRVKRMNEGKEMYHVWCPVCKVYYWSKP